VSASGDTCCGRELILLDDRGIGVQPECPNHRAQDEQQRLDDQADYSARGRSYKDLSEQELTGRWVQTFKTMVQDLRNYELRASFGDITLEFQARGKAPPYELVPEELKRYYFEADAMIAEIRQDPDKFYELSHRMAADIDAFKTARDKSKN
jgi:hypothetical protein